MAVATLCRLFGLGVSTMKGVAPGNTRTGKACPIPLRNGPGALTLLCDTWREWCQPDREAKSDGQEPDYRQSDEECELAFCHASPSSLHRTFAAGNVATKPVMTVKS